MANHLFSFPLTSLPPLNPAASTHQSSHVRQLPLTALLPPIQPSHPRRSTHPSHPSSRSSQAVDRINSSSITVSSAGTRKLAFGSLMSPPDQLLDSLTSDPCPPSSSLTPAQSPAMPTSKPSMPMSPPISPSHNSSHMDHRQSTPRFSINAITQSALMISSLPDPILYPTIDNHAVNHPPLFADVGPSRFLLPSSLPNTVPHSPIATDYRDIVDNHMAARPAGLFDRVPPPARPDYELMLDLRSAVMQIFSHDPVRWLKKERSFLLADRLAHRLAHRFAGRLANKRSKFDLAIPAPAAFATPKLAAPRVRSHRPGRSDRPDRVRKSPKSQKSPKSPKSPRPASSTTGPRPLPPELFSRPTVKPTESTAESRRAVAPSREDKAFAFLPDYCPPLTSLPAWANCLKVDWKGAPIDLSTDPNVDLLHPHELSLAASLRLDCATYLTSKRRIFVRRLECARSGKDFRKTDAQQACKIDVNKASKLWSAFEKVGWLRHEWVIPHLG